MVYKNKKLSDGIYCIKLGDEKIMVCLIGKSVEDFKASYEKMKNSKTNKENRENQEESNKQESLIKNSDSNAINNKTVREWRTMKVNKEKVKSVVKKAVVLIAASLMTISLFACGGKVETKMEYPSISIDQDVNTGNDSKVKVTEEVVKPTEIKETKKYVEETTKPIKTTEQSYANYTLSREELRKSLGLDNDDEQKTGTDALGNPYLQKGQEYTFKDNGMGEPVEAPYKGRTAVNPNTGVKYIYNSVYGWHVDTSEQDAEEERLRKEGYVRNSDGEWVQGRKMTEEELNKYAKMFSDSFK